MIFLFRFANANVGGCLTHEWPPSVTGELVQTKCVRWADSSSGGQTAVGRQSHVHCHVGRQILIARLESKTHRPTSPITKSRLPKMAGFSPIRQPQRSTPHSRFQKENHAPQPVRLAALDRFKRLEAVERIVRGLKPGGNLLEVHHGSQPVHEALQLARGGPDIKGDNRRGASGRAFSRRASEREKVGRTPWKPP